MKKKKITVIGAGSGGLSFAAWFLNKGNEVTVYDNDNEKTKSLKQKKKIRVTGILDMEINTSILTDSIEEAVSDSNLIMVSITTNDIKDFAKEFAPLANKDQMVVLNPGHTFGAIELMHILNKHNVKTMPIIVEAQDLIFTSRTDKDLNLKISGIKKEMDIAAYNPSDINTASCILKEVFPQINPVKNVWLTSLNNISSILHPIPSLLNLSRIEYANEFRYYYDGISKTVGDIMNRADEERLEIGKALGLELTSVVNWMKGSYDTYGGNIYECIKNNKSYSEIMGPKSINHRFIYEDLLSGLVPLVSMANKLSVKTPVMETFIKLGSFVSNTDYIMEGRTLEKIGLGDVSALDIKLMFK